MSTLFGYWKVGLEVNLSTQAIEEKELSDDFLRKYLGGAGFTTRILYDLVGPDCDPLDPESALIVAPGVLLGPAIPTASKTTFGFKSPLTGGYGKSLVGAKLGDKLKRSGYDYLVITGRAGSPSILVIENDQVRIEESKKLWGLDTFEAGEEIKGTYPGFSTAIIGPAGENLSKIACIECEDRQAGRGGGGAVMGTKNLKAMAVNGDKDLPIYDQGKLDQLKSKWRKETTGRGESSVSGTGSATVDMEYGTGEALHTKNTELGMFPTRNWQSGYFKKAYQKLEDPDKDRIDIDPRKWTKIYRQGRRPCPYCTKPCSQYFKATGTPYGDIAVDGPEYETQYSLGGACEIDDIEAVAKGNEICDRLGLDTISAGLAVAWAMEAAEKGLLETDIDLNFGNPRAMLETLRQIGHREGKLGKLLADGVEDAAKKVGQGSDEFAIHVKGLSPAGFEVRGIKGMALAFAVAPRGADHLTSCLYALEMGNSFWKYQGYDHTQLTGKANALKNMEDLMMTYDMTGVCKFSRGLMYDQGQLELVNAVTGFDMSLSEFLTAGERAYQLSKAYNVREGFGRQEDTLPPRLLKEELPDGPSKGRRITSEEFQQELSRYYQIRGWNGEGIPLKITLHRLELPEVAEELGAVKE